MKAHVILNPTAGQTVERAELERALNYLAEAGWTLTERESYGPGAATELAHAAAVEGADAVIVMGGDGTLNEAANGLVGSGTALGLLPMGTGNVWAAQSGLMAWPTLLYRPDLLTAAQALAASHPHQVDLGLAHTRAGERYFLLFAGVGLDAMITQVLEGQARPLKRRFGQLAYLWAGARPILEFRGANARLYVDGVERKGRVLFLVIGNVQFYAGVPLIPEARVDDGWLDVCVFEGYSWAHSIAHIARIALGRRPGDPSVTHQHAREVTLYCDPPLPVQYDGDPFGTTPLTVRVVPRALTVLLPPNTPADLLAHP